jgi:hypothetical protein
MGGSGLPLPSKGSSQGLHRSAYPYFEVVRPLAATAVTEAVTQRP